MTEIVRLPGGRLDDELRGMDNLELPIRPAAVNRLRSVWSNLWPKLAAIGIPR